MYLLQFRLKVYYKFEKSNIVFNVFSCFFSETEKINIINNLNVNSFYNITIKNNIKKFLIQMSNEFRVKLIVKYFKNST